MKRPCTESCIEGRAKKDISMLTKILFRLSPEAPVGPRPELERFMAERERWGQTLR